MLELLMPDLSTPLHWAWLGQHIVINKPVTIRVLCTELFAIDTLLQVFRVSGIPWSVHYNANTLPPALSRDIVLILSHGHLETNNAIELAADSVNAYRARYLVTHLSYVDDKSIRSLGVTAWSLKLFRVLIVRLEDRAIFAALPRCHLPQVAKVPKVQWPDLRNMDLTDCTLQVAVFNLTPFYTFQSADEKSLKGIWLPFFRFLQLALNFRALIVPVDYRNISDIVMSGQVDMTFTTFIITPDMPLEAACFFTSELCWCVPNTCGFRDTTALLWKEFSTMAWVFIATSVVAVSIVVKFTASSPSLTFGDAATRIIAIVVAISVRLPNGHARWPLVGWLLASVVLGCCYQTVLHSMMTAPLSGHTVENLYDLRKSMMGLACVAGTCTTLLELENDTGVEADLARRVTKIYDITKGLSSFISTNKPASFFTSTTVCERFYTGMRPLPDYRVNQLLYGMVGVTPWSWLSPAFRRIMSQAESSGLTRLWLESDSTDSCVSVGTKEIKPIKIKLLWPAILLMSAGLLSGMVAFVIEVFWFRCTTSFKKSKSKDFTGYKPRRPLAKRKVPIT